MIGGEVSKVDVKDVKTQGGEKFENIKPEKEMSYKELNDAVYDEFNKAAKETKVQENKTQESVEPNQHEGLTDKERIQIKEETNWSDEIIDHIENMDQYDIYKEADLKEAIIGDRKCLIKDIDMDYYDPKTEKTNRELMNDGKSPIDSKTGEKIELHHMGQEFDAPFAELCENSEHGDGNHSVLHIKLGESWRNDPGLNNQYNNTEKPKHWIERAKEV